MVQALREAPPDVLVVDEGLPPRGGLAACLELRARSELQVVPILALVRADTPRGALRAYVAGCDDVVPLPADLQMLTTRVTSLARLHRGRGMVPAEAVLHALLQAVEARDPDTQGPRAADGLYGPAPGAVVWAGFFFLPDPLACGTGS